MGSHTQIIIIIIVVVVVKEKQKVGGVERGGRGTKQALLSARPRPFLLLYCYIVLHTVLVLLLSENGWWWFGCSGSFDKGKQVRNPLLQTGKVEAASFLPPAGLNSLPEKGAGRRLLPRPAIFPWGGGFDQRASQKKALFSSFGADIRDSPFSIEEETLLPLSGPPPSNDYGAVSRGRAPRSRQRQCAGSVA